MDPERISTPLGENGMKMLRRIADSEGLPLDLMLLQVVVRGMRFYQNKNRLGCGYDGCTRAGCCAPAKPPQDCAGDVSLTAVPDLYS
jgi:hypothetical protein